MENCGIPVFLSADNGYAPFVATTIASICDHTRSFIDFYILDGGITEENKRKIEELKKLFSNFSIEFIPIDVDFYFRKFQTNSQYYSKSMYSRYLIPDIKPNIQKAIYSDVDVIVLGDIKSMYDIDLENYIIGAIASPFLMDKPIMSEIKKNYNISQEHIYFCSGNLLIDCQKWRENNILKKLFDIQKAFLSDTPACDQDILNKCFDANYKEISYRYCATEYHLKYFQSCPDMVIRHFGVPTKPWMINPSTKTSLCPNLLDFWKYAKMTLFYDELLNNVSDDEQQKSLMRKLHIRNIWFCKEFSSKNDENC